jgi:hypothetical protein
MHPIAVLPDASLQPGTLITDLFLRRGARTFHQACQWVKDQPYGSNARFEDPLVLFEEGRGTCFTKHGAIVELARELGLDVHKSLGFYRLTEEIVTGIDALIRPHGLTFVPQIHCFLEYCDFRVDLTEGNSHGKNRQIEDYEFVVRAEPHWGREELQRCYYEHIAHYTAIEPRLATLPRDVLQSVLMACNKQCCARADAMAGAAAAQV